MNRSRGFQKDENLKIGWFISFCFNLIEEGFNGGGEVFAAVAGLTGRDDIASRTFSFPGQWHHMVHGQVFRSHLLMTKVTFPFLDLGFPPWGFP